jgi:aminoglycoside/choline kinase family phosphotransferase
MKDRNFYLNCFLKKHHISQIQWLSGDASTRRYARVTKKNKSYILMDSPLSEKPKEFVLVDKILRKHYISAPKIYAKSLRHGFMLLEDFGSENLSQSVKDKSKADELYILALDTLIRLQKNVTEHHRFENGLPLMIEQTNLFIEYYVPEILKIQLSQQAQDEFKSIWYHLLKKTEQLPQTLMLYDYHLDNIMLKKDNTLGLLDFQDAMRGCVFYDLVSFVEDERYPLPLNKRNALYQHYFDLCPVLATPKYADLLPVVAAHRHTRVMGIFGRLATKYQKPQYLKYIPNDWDFLKENLKSPLLKDYKKWLETYLPQQMKDLYK